MKVPSTCRRVAASMIAATLAKALQGGGPYPLDGYGRYFAPCIGTAQSNGYAGAKEENKQPNIRRTAGELCTSSLAPNAHRQKACAGLSLRAPTNTRSWDKRGRVERSPGADMVVLNPVLEQMWQGEPSPGANGWGEPRFSCLGLVPDTHRLRDILRIRGRRGRHGATDHSCTCDGEGPWP